MSLIVFVFSLMKLDRTKRGAGIGNNVVFKSHVICIFIFRILHYNEMNQIFIVIAKVVL